jgi:PHP domain
MIRRMVSLMCVCVCLSPFALGCNEIASPPLEGTWYKGDLHCHSTHSDGDSSVAEVIASAESKGLDFFVITDHDGNMDGSPSQWYDPDYHSEAMVMLYGVEWTTGLGHANVWASQPFDYEDLWLANRAQDARAAIDAAHEQGALFSINHPSARLCCPWEYEDDSGIDSIEVWNSMFWLPNFNYFSTRGFWDDRLLSGQRTTGVGGSDTHQLKGFESNFLRHAEPTTWVLSEEPSADALLAAIRAGHVSISDQPAGPRIDLQADTDEDGVYDTMMGDNVRLAEETDVTFRISVGVQDPLDDGETVVDLTSQVMAGDGRIDAETPENLVSAFLNTGEYLALLFKNGRLHGLWKISGEPSRIEWTERVAPEEQIFCRVELLGSPPVDPINRLLRGFTKALSNPIYFGYSE